MKISIGRGERTDFLLHLVFITIALATLCILTLPRLFNLAADLTSSGDVGAFDLLPLGGVFENLLIALVLFYLVSCVVFKLYYRYKGRDGYVKKSLLVFTAIYALCGGYILLQLSPREEALSRVIFLAGHGRPMGGREATLNAVFGDTRLADEEYCDTVGGRWHGSSLYCGGFSFGRNLNCFSFCMPPTRDSGKECDADADCESYCVADADAVNGKCYGYLIDDRDASGLVHEMKK